MVEQAATPELMVEDEVNSVFSQDDDGGSSGDETSRNGPASAGKKRKRAIRYQKTSCELCKARKVKCDRAEPACSWCARHNRACVYLERQKPGSRIGFALELESKVNRVDALLQTLWRRVEDHIANDHRAPPAETLSPTVSNHNHSPVDRLPPLSTANANGLPSRLVAISPVSRQHERTPITFTSPSWRDQDGRGLPPFVSGPPPPPTGLSDPAVPFHPSDPAAPRVAVSRLQMLGSSSLPGGADLPPHDMVYTLVDLYFKHCNTWCPILDRKSTFGIFFGSTSLAEVDRVLLHAIVATTLRFLKDTRLSPEMRAHYHAVSKRTVMVYSMEHVSFAALKALVILALDELGTSNGPRGWNLLSLLAQNVRHLNLGEENSVYLSAGAVDMPYTGSVRRVAVGRPESWIEDEGRRRLCWMVYLLDRYATIATTTLDFILDDRRMRRVLPCSYDLFSKNEPVETRSLDPMPDARGVAAYAVDRPENLGSFSYHCEILRILSRVHEFLQAPVDVASPADMADWRNTYRSLDAALDNWLQSLPSEYSRISALCHSDPASRVANWFMLHSAYVTSVVRLHSSAAYPTVRSHAFVPSHYAMQRCLSAVQSLRDITQDVYEANGLDLVGPPFGFSLWVAARLLIVHAATMGGPVDTKIDFFVDILGYVGQYWEVAKNYARVLARVVHRGRQGETSFAAMRKSAYDLVNLTSSTRRSGLEETSSRSVSLSELDSIDVFDFFNYPKTPVLSSRVPNGQRSILQPQEMVGVRGEAHRNMAVPDPESDWLGYGTTFR